MNSMQNFVDKPASFFSQLFHRRGGIFLRKKREDYVKIEFLKTPSTIDIVIGAFQLFLIEKLYLSKKTASLPTSIDGYKLAYSIDKNNNVSRLATGIYTKDSKQYFVKYWNGKVKDLTYYFLVHEYLVTALLSNKFDSSDIDVKTPEVFGVYEGPNSIAVIFEFIEGVTLEQLSLGEQTRHWNGARIALQKVSKVLSREERQIIGCRSAMFYIGVLSAILPMVLILSKSNRKVVLKAWLENIKELGSLSRVGLVLAHRDLMPNNILLGKDSRIYIIDWDNARITLPDYDFANLKVFINQKKFLDLVDYEFSEKTVIFLRSHIAIYQTLGSGKFASFNKKYLGALY